MKNLIGCEFNMDTVCVELRYTTIDMAITCAAVSCDFAVTKPMPHLCLARLKHRSTSTRLHSSICACRLSATASFFGLPSARPKSRI